MGFNPGPAPGRMPAVPAVTPDIRYPQRLRMEGVQIGWGTLWRGPGRSRRALDLAATTSFAAGGILLVCSAYVHFHLWSGTDGYRSIPTIGPLFLLQSITGLVLGLGVIAVRRVWAALIGIGFVVATVAGFLVSVTHGLLGFKDSWMAPFAKEAFTIEIVAATVLVIAVALCLIGSAPRVRTGSTPAGTAT